MRPGKIGLAAGLGLAAATASLWTAAAPAQVLRNHDSRAPVDFSAGAIEIQDRADRVVLAGDVAVTQAGLTIRSQRMTIAYTQGSSVDVNRIDAVGGVTITKGDERAVGNSAVYDLDRRLITLIGDVALTQGSNRLTGGRVVIDLESGRSTIDGRGAGGPAVPGTTSEAGGRVSGTFTVPQRK